MPRAAAGTPKAIANAMKSKGLQRLRWYCQPCGKQCRDENGFKCHAMSEGHLRQMMVVGENPGKIINEYSSAFHADFMKLFSRRFGQKRVKANTVYQEYISDKNHAHMNASRWTTLTEYCFYLGKAGLAKVEMLDGVLWIEYIDREPDTLRKKAAYQKKERADMNDEELQRKLIKEQIARTKAMEEAEEACKPSRPELDAPVDVSAPIKMSLAFAQAPSPTSCADSSASSTPAPSASLPSAAPIKVNPLKAAAKPNPLKAAKSNPLKGGVSKPKEAEMGPKKPLTAVEAIMAEEEERKRRKEMWAAQDRDRGRY